MNDCTFHLLSSGAERRLRRTGRFGCFRRRHEREWRAGEERSERGAGCVARSQLESGTGCPCGFKLDRCCGGSRNTRTESTRRQDIKRGIWVEKNQHKISGDAGGEDQNYYGKHV